MVKVNLTSRWNIEVFSAHTCTMYACMSDTECVVVAKRTYGFMFHHSAAALLMPWGLLQPVQWHVCDAYGQMCVLHTSECAWRIVAWMDVRIFLTNE